MLECNIIIKKQEYDISMKKSEFIKILEEQLCMEIPREKALAHVQYYERYIQDQIQSGKTEQDVLDLLGDPRLIAKTLVDTNPLEESAGSESFSGQNYYEENYQQNSSSGRPSRPSFFHWLDLSTWYGKAAAIAIAAFIIVLLITILSALLPFILCLMLIGFLISYFRKRQ